MEQLKVRKKGIIVVNCIFYLMLSFFFVYLQYAYRSHVTPFSLLYLQKSLQIFWFIVLVLVFSAVLLWKHHKYCTVFFGLSASVVSYKILEGLFIEFNKMIVVAFFFYIVITYFLFQLLQEYLASARLNANYQHHDLYDPLLNALKCRVIGAGEEVSGVLTNWDDEGCFLKLDHLPSKNLKKVELIISFEGREFVEQGEVVARSTTLNGIGIKLRNSSKDLKIFNWNEFIELVNELGFDPKRLR